MIRELLPAQAPILWALVALLSVLPIASRLLHRAKVENTEILTVVGNYWLATVFSSVLARAFVDTAGLIDRYVPFVPQALKTTSGHIAVCGTVFILLLGYGLWNARHPVVRTYDITVNKGATIPFTLRAVLVSDLHLGGIIGRRRVEKLVALVNRLEPQIVFLVGDTVDDDVEYVAAHDIIGLLGGLKSRLGTFAVLGNHEYISGNPAKVVRLLQVAGINVLRDQAVAVAGKFIVAGRDDLSKRRRTGAKRQSAADLLADVDKSLPVILLDHQPRTLAEAAAAGVDIQVSGHTHKGQFFSVETLLPARSTKTTGDCRKPEAFIPLSPAATEPGGRRSGSVAVQKLSFST